MVKYGRGLNREIVGAVNRGIIKDIFSIKDVQIFISKNNWDIPETYVFVCLANGSSLNHSLTYKKYFESMGDGLYSINNSFKGDKWK